MVDTLGKGFLGSLRRRVIHEVRLHQHDNVIVQRARYPFATRWLRAVLADRAFHSFLFAYLAIDLALTVAEVFFPETRLPPWTGDAMKGLLKDSAGYLITAQVGILGVVSVAVGLVTLIAQQGDNSTTSTDIRLYYSEALAYDVIASSVALLIVLAIQIFWPLQFGIHQVGWGSTNLFYKDLLSALHIAWLILNLAGFAQFLFTTLRFVEPRAREDMRERYTANIVLPDDIRKHLFRHFLLLAPKVLIPAAGDEDGPLLTVGHDWIPTGITEIERRFRKPSRLIDIRMWPLRIALRNWWRRDIKKRRSIPANDRSLLNLRPQPAVAFPVSFDETLEGRTILCRRDGGVEFRSWELILIVSSFRFGAAKKSTRTVAPSPSAFLEELADKVIGQIDRLAVTGFNAALAVC